MPHHSAIFLKSAARLEQCPRADRPEVAFVGRSNSGKSSLINALVGQKALAKVSSKPGKTRLLNFFDFGPYRFVDMPGYGYASRGGDEQRSWQSMIEGYLKNRESLAGLVLIMDARRSLEEGEQLLLRFAQEQNLPVLLVLNKIDKLNRAELGRIEKQMRSQAPCPWIFISALKKMGLEKTEEYIFENWIKPFLFGKPS